MIVWLNIGIAAIAFGSFGLGFIAGRRAGHKIGMEAGRRVGTYWERRYWLNPMGPTAPPDDNL